MHCLLLSLYFDRICVLKVKVKLNLLQEACSWFLLIFFFKFIHQLYIFDWSISSFTLELLLIGKDLLEPLFSGSLVPFLPLSLPSFLNWWIFHNGMPWFPSFYFLCIYCRFLFCGCHEAYRKHLMNITVCFTQITSITYKTSKLLFLTPVTLCFWCQNLTSFYVHLQIIIVNALVF